MYSVSFTNSIITFKLLSLPPSLSLFCLFYFCILELRFLSFGLEIDDGSQTQSKQKLIFIAMSVAEKAQWIADIAQVHYTCKLCFKYLKRVLSMQVIAIFHELNQKWQKC